MNDNGKPVCDFCRSTDVEWEYPAKDFVLDVEGIGVGSSGSWAACGACHDLIERGDKSAVVERALAASDEAREDPAIYVVLRGVMIVVHTHFYASRLGPARPAAVA